MARNKFGNSGDRLIFIRKQQWLQKSMTEIAASANMTPQAVDLFLWKNLGRKV